MLPSLEKTFKDIAHVNPVTVRSHSHADMGSMTRKLNRQEVAAYQEQVEMIYDHFINIVAEGRGMTPERVDEIATRSAVLRKPWTTPPYRQVWTATG